MSTNPKRQRHHKRKLIVCILLLGIFGCSVYFFNAFLMSRKPLFISPVGRTNADLVLIEKKLKDKNILFSQASLSDNSYLIGIQNNGQIRLSLDKDIDKQIASLQRILNQLTIEGKLFKSIDFRFSEPIISF